MKKVLSVVLMSVTLGLQASIPAGILKLDNAPFGAGSLARDVKLQADGKIVACGYTTSGGFTRFTVARFTTTGALDTDFNPDGAYPGVVQETSFGDSDQQALALVINTAGKIIVVGQTTTWTVIQYNSDGSHDTGFNATGVIQEGPSGYASAIALDPTDEKIFVVGNIDGSLSTKRYSTTGALEVTSPVAPAITTNVNILLGITVNTTQVAVYYLDTLAGTENILIIMDHDLTLTETVPGTDLNYCGLGLVTRSDGLIIKMLNNQSGINNGGYIQDQDGLNTLVLSRPNLDFRYLTAGDLIISSPTSPSAVMFFSFCDDNKHPALGKTNYDLSLANNFGSTDGVVNTSGIVLETTIGTGFYSAVALQANGKVVVAGWSTEFVWTMARYNSDGSRDTTFIGTDFTGVLQDTASPFSESGNGLVYGECIDADGNITLCGNYNNNWMMVKYSNTAARVTSFNGDGVVLDSSLGVATAKALIQDANGNYYVAGESTVNGTTVLTVAKYSNVGELVSSFGTNGIVQLPSVTYGQSRATSLVLTADNKLLVTGQVTVDGTLYAALAAYDQSGTLIPTFGTNGVQIYQDLGTGIVNTVLSNQETDTATAGGQTTNQATLLQAVQTSPAADYIASGM